MSTLHDHYDRAINKTQLKPGSPMSSRGKRPE
jgi:hypothetical protein